MTYIRQEKFILEANVMMYEVFFSLRNSYSIIQSSACSAFDDVSCVCRYSILEFLNFLSPKLGGEFVSPRSGFFYFLFVNFVGCSQSLQSKQDHTLP